MNFPDQPPPHPFMALPFAGGNVGGFWPQIPINNDHSQLDYAPPFKRQRNSAPPMNPRMNHQNLPVNEGTTHIFFKTRVCLKFMEDNCRNGEDCNFAHGYDELRQPPPNWQELVLSGRGKDRGEGNLNDDQKIIHRMKICKKFYNGEECPYGDKCNFLHEDPSKIKVDIETPRESSVISKAMGPTMGYVSGPDQSEYSKNLNTSFDASRLMKVYWKTKLCSKWEITGQCPFGERCHFAHGQSDERTKDLGGPFASPELKVHISRIEAEVINTFSTNIKPLATPANDSSPAMVDIALTNRAGAVKKCLSKWKVTKKKINCIYADWIDDLTPPHNFASIVEI